MDSYYVDSPNLLNIVAVKILLTELYEEIKHGDDEHQKWLKDKIEDFVKRKLG